MLSLTPPLALSPSSEVTGSLSAYSTGSCSTSSETSTLFGERPKEIGRYTISEVPSEEWDSISRIAGEWSKIAYDKMCEVGKCDSRYNIFSNSKELCGDIEEALSNLTSASSYRNRDTILICNDSAGNTQAIALHDTTTNTLSAIVTNPNNIKAPNPAESCHSATVGAGTAIMIYLARETLFSKEPSLKICALEEAVTFYRKLSFEQTYETSPCLMRLTKVKIQELVTSKAPLYRLIA